MKIGTMVHALAGTGLCGPGFVVDYNPDRDEIRFVGFRSSEEESFSAHFATGNQITHDPACQAVPAGSASWHTADECVWDR